MEQLITIGCFTVGRFGPYLAPNLSFNLSRNLVKLGIKLGPSTVKHLDLFSVQLPSVAHSYLAVIQRFIFIRILCTVYTHQFRVPNICLGPLF